MKKYIVKEMQFSEEEINNMHAIGVYVGVELYIDNAFSSKEHMCYIRLDNSVFCMRKEDVNKLVLEEIK